MYKAHKVFVPALILAVSLFSCTSTVDKTIDQKNVASEVSSIKGSKNDLDSNQRIQLNTLAALAEGREALLDSLVSRTDTSYDGLRGRFDKVVVPKEKFKSSVNNLFDHFRSNKVSYKDLLSEWDTLKTIKEKYSERLDKVYEEVDKLCQKKQKEVEKKLKKIKEQKEKLSKIVDVELLRIYETKHNYRDVVVVKVRFKNNTEKRIEALSFDMTLRDKLNNVVATLNFKSNKGFNNSSVGQYVYEEIEDSQMFDKLENVDVSDVSAEVTVDKIRHGGELISAHSGIDGEMKPMNYEYESPDDPFGYCPYLKDDHELMKKIDGIQKERKDEIQNRLEHLSKYQKITSGLFKSKNKKSSS